MIFSPELNNQLDGSVVRIAQHIDTGGIPLLPMTRIEGYKFNPELLKLKEYILLDYSELYWNSENEDTHLFGKNTHEFPEQFPGDEWNKFEDFVRTNPPKIYFKRELKKKDVGGNVHCVDYPCWTAPYPIQTKQEFDNRVLEVFHFWGRSHEERVRFHSEVWANSSRNGASVCDNIFSFNDFIRWEGNPKKWASFYMPHYCRVDIKQILAINGMAKLSVSLFGAGKKCFRTTGESPVNSVMVMQDSDLAYSYEWIHEYNCLKFPTTKIDMPLLDEFVKRDDLYEIYLLGMNTVDKYRINNYVNNYIQPIIQKA